MYKVEYDMSKNRINICVKGTLTEQETSCYIDDVLKLVDMAKPHFTVCANLLECDLEFLTDGSKLKVIRERGIQKGVKLVAHVLNHAALAHHRTTPVEGVVNAFSDIIEAERFLDASMQPLPARDV